jgi:hypothetical protein
MNELYQSLWCIEAILILVQTKLTGILLLNRAQNTNMEEEIKS